MGGEREKAVAGDVPHSNQRRGAGGWVNGMDDSATLKEEEAMQ